MASADSLTTRRNHFQLVRAVSILHDETAEYTGILNLTDHRSMPIRVSICHLSQISTLREQYRAEMQCQIIHDSIHVRPGWSEEYLLEIDGAVAGYGSVAIGGACQLCGIWNCYQSSLPAIEG